MHAVDEERSGLSAGAAHVRARRLIARTWGRCVLRAAALLGLVLVALVVFDVRVQQAQLEGDELVHVLLVDQLARGAYGLRGTPLLGLPQFSAYLYDRAVHYNPPLYDLVLLGVKTLWSPAGYVWLSVLAAAACTWLVYRITRRRTAPLAAAVAALLFLGCPIVYLVSCRIWAEATLMLLICLALELCDRIGSRPNRPPSAATQAWLVALLAAAALTKASVLFVLPGLWWLTGTAGRHDHRLRGLILGVPIALTLLWLGYVARASLLAPAARVALDDRFTNPFVAELASRPALSLFYLPFVLNPGYLLALGALRRPQRRDAAPFALCVAGGIGAFSALAWAGQGTYHTKYLSCVLPMLAILAGVGFDALAEASRRAGALRLGLVAVVAALLIYENTVHRRTWVAELDPSLYFSSVTTR